MAENGIPGGSDRHRQIWDLVERVAFSMGFEVIELEFAESRQRGLLRVYIDREGGVGVDDCARLSRELDVVLDVEDLVRGAYTLEVSSPGIERPIRRPSDFARFAGSRVRVRLREKIDGRRQVEGILGSIEQADGADPLAVVTPDGGEAIRIPLSLVQRATLAVDFDRLLKGGDE